eukprot:GEZU01009140.1.p1 GENE.GEZU01009140.1~~GEZU01009140.1.p1  ORF type:complete len:273 (-),score=80.00 GEZU01009140.1:188-1006(-)
MSSSYRSAGGAGGPLNEKLLTVSLDDIADQISDLSALVKSIEKRVNDLGTPKDGEKFRKRLKEDREKANAMTKSISERMKHVSCAAGEKMKYEKLSTQFVSVMEQCKKVYKESMEKEKKIVVRLSHDIDAEKRTVLDGDDEYEPDLQKAQAQRYRLTAYDAATIKTEEMLAEEMNRDIKALETDLLELHEAFNDFAHAIDEQQEDITLIADNISKANVRVEKGAEEMNKARQYQKSSRNKMCCIIILVVLIAAGIAVALTVGGVVLKLLHLF